MKLKEMFKGFSLKKMLLTILCTVIVSVFVSATMTFVRDFNTYTAYESVAGLHENHEKFKEVVSQYDQEVIQGYYDNVEQQKEEWEKDIPTRALTEILLKRFESENRVHVYVTSVVMGVALGIVIYVIAIQKANIKQAVIELLIAFAILIAIIILVNHIYMIILGHFTQNAFETIIDFGGAELYYLEDNTLIIVYVVAAVILYVGNLIKQKMLANKLNKELNNK
ncbi:MAG: hypothetical protein IKK43_06560 [Clostridia bacterium]|nr:hypothetical protein [Clostridia bacterium]